ncbi:MAG: 30S ribosomal protein S16 [Acidimicrobiales bacterium]|nr:30S ribosomal protein S16 [Acidimicrobiales bacterium]
MAVKLRLMRMGKKKQPTYRVVAADARSPRDGRFIEIVGTYEPRRDPSVIKIDNDRAVHWLQVGAQPTERVRKLLEISGAWESYTGTAPTPRVTRAASAVSAPAEEAAPAAPADEPVAADSPADEAPADDAQAAEAAEVESEDAPADAADAADDAADTDGGEES